MIVEITAVATMAATTATTGVVGIRSGRIRKGIEEMTAGVEAEVATTEEAKIMIGIEVAATKMTEERTEATTRMVGDVTTGLGNQTTWATTLSTAGSARSYLSTSRETIMRSTRDRAGVISVRQASAPAHSKVITVTLVEEAVADSAEAEVEVISIAVVALAQPSAEAKRSSSPRTRTRFRSPRICTSSPWQRT